MRIDIFSDVVCPWCFIGKRRLDAALAAAAISDADIHWHAFQLNPDMPAEGVDRRRYLEEKFGGAEKVARMHERVSEVGRSTGIEFQWDRIVRSPNTYDAHRLLQLSATEGRQHALKEALFRAYFLEGRDLGNRAVLTAVAAETGMKGDVAGRLAGDDGVEQVREDLATAAQLNITGVPFFIFAGRYALPGAQPPELFAQALVAARPIAGDAA